MKYKFNELEIKKQRRIKRIGLKKENTGIDTETYQGKAILIASSDKKFKIALNFYDILGFLTRKYFENKFNFFFNLQFDLEAIFKHLNEEELRELYQNKALDYGKYHLSYIPHKIFIIKYEKKKYSFYDINNFLSTSLNHAAKTFLGKTKLEIEANRLNSDLNYWKQNIEKIIAYCINDAIITKELADYFFNLMEKTLDFRPINPVSKGKFSEEYFSYRCFIPKIDKLERPILEFAYNSYYGGRFELLKRGFFKNVYSYDIKSAYPSVIKDLIDITKGNWKNIGYFDRSAFYGFYKCQIEHYHNILSPFMQKIVLNVYPNGKFSQYLTQEEILTIQKLFPNTKIEIEEGWVFYPDAYYFPFKSEIERLYEWKEKEDNAEIKYAIKIVLNSLYGKFIQTVSGKTGNIFNPIYASIITANTRLKLLEKTKDYWNSLIGFSTDAIHSIKPIKFDWNEKNGLGEFELAFEGFGVFLMSDIYSIHGKEKIKNKFRGFMVEGYGNSDFTDNLFDLLEKMTKSKIKIKYTRPIHLGESLIHVHKHSVSDINLWYSFDKIFDVNGDKKRVWDADFESGREVLYTNHSSSPLLIFE